MSTLEQRVAALEGIVGKHMIDHIGLVREHREAKEWPQEEDIYWYVHMVRGTRISGWSGNKIDLWRKSIGNIFRTEAEAEAEIDRRKTMTKLREIAARVNGDGVPEVNDNIYIVMYWRKEDYVTTSIKPWRHGLMNQVYFRTEEGAEQAINELGDELKGLYV